MRKFNNHWFNRATAITTAIVLCSSLLCGCGSKHLETHYEDNDNSNIQDWDNVGDDNVVEWDDVSITWDDVEDYSDWVYSQTVFDGISDEYPLVECKIFDYSTNGQYFDGEKVYELVGDKFDVNTFLAKYAVGTGVIMICVVLNVATAGGTTPIVCFIAGAAEGATTYAVKGAAFGAAMGAISEAIKSEGNVIEDSFYGALEGSADGYMWGAIFGAIDGSWNSKYCFTEDTLVKTPDGYKCISEISIEDSVYSFDEKNCVYAYKPVTQINRSSTDQIIEITSNNEVIKVTANHPFLSSRGWVQAGELSTSDLLITSDYGQQKIDKIDIVDSSTPIDIYTLCVDDYHTFLVGENQFVVHNRCNPNEKYAGQTRYIEDDPALAQKYPDGVFIKETGYPDFSPYKYNKGGFSGEVSFELPSQAGVDAGKCLRGDCYYDFKMANKAAGFGDSVSATPKGWTWHHCEDGKTMQLIPTDLHRKIGHDGGEKVIAQLLGK